MKRTFSNGYVIVHCPEHAKANNEGYVYEHILVAEKKIGRKLKKSEVVHHLDFNRANNKPGNLLVLLRSQHRVLHAWMEKGAPIAQHAVSLKKKVKPIVTGKVRVSSSSNVVCIRCGQSLITQDSEKFCSAKCSSEAQRKVDITAKRMKKLMAKYPWTKIGKKLGVSDVGARKIAIRLGCL